MVSALLRTLHPVRWLPMPKTRRLRWQLARINRAYERDKENAKKARASRDQLEEIQHGWQSETDEIREELDALRTRRLLLKAYRLDVPVLHRPWHTEEHRNENWEQGHMTGFWHLTVVGFNKVRADIRAEILARHETRARWILWVTALTGLVGALTGLFAVLARK